MNPNHALIVGVGADLPMTVTDAQGIASILADPTRCGFDPAHVCVLTGREATRERILPALDDLSAAPADASVVVYFSGHGVESPDYHLLPYGYDLRNLPATCISGALFTEKLRAIRARKLLVLLDCCHAGGQAEAKGPITAGANTSGTIKSPLPPEVSAALSSGSGRVVIASSRRDEVSLAGRPYSVFTAALLEGLAGYGAFEQDGYARVLDLAMWVGRKVPERTGDKQHPIVKVSNLQDNFSIAWYAGGAKSPLALSWTAGAPTVSPALSPAQVVSWQRQLANYRENLLLIDERISEYVDYVSVPLQLIKNQRATNDRIMELERQLGLRQE
jgi:hypothetical protein